MRLYKTIIITLFALLVTTGAVCSAEGTEVVVSTRPTKQEIVQDYLQAESINTAAAMCLGLYDTKKAPELGFLADYGWKITPFKLKEGKVDSSMVIAKNHLVAQDIDLYVLAFRGSVTTSDWLLNLDAGKTPYEPELAKLPKPDSSIPMVHKGFNNYVNTVLNIVMDIDEDGDDENFIEEIKNNPKARLLLTGHSLGGAAATLLAERLVSMGFAKERVPVITFGAPAIGNAAFADAYGDKILLLRVINASDPIPGSLQTFVGGYKQFGTPVSYKISRKFSDQQHEMALYFEMSISRFYAAFDAAVAAGLLKKPPMEYITPGMPKVAVWVGAGNTMAKKPYVPDVKRFIVNQYQHLLPSYVIIEEPDSIYRAKTFSYRQYVGEAQAMGADYILLVEIDAYQPRSKDSSEGISFRLLSKNHENLIKNPVIA